MGVVQEIVFDTLTPGEDRFSEDIDGFSLDAMFAGFSDMLDVKDLAAILRVSVKTVQRQCARGDLPAVKIGRHWYVAKIRLARLLLGVGDGEQ